MNFSIRRKLGLFHYNIGFCKVEETLLQARPQIHWMVHPYKDRFFADPFILDVTNAEIHVLVEEFFYNRWKGNISLLKVDRGNYQLKSIKPLLDLDTHLSFPFIIREPDGIYVMPENGHSGSCKIYRWIKGKEELKYYRTIIDQPLVDPVIFEKDGKCILLASIMGKSENEQLYAWSADSLNDDFHPQTGTLVKTGLSDSRRGGGLFLFGNHLYSATQSCVKRYGEALNICRVENIDADNLSEQPVVTYYPEEPYPYGLHTFNVYKGVGVVDGLTSLFRPVEKIGAIIRNQISKIHRERKQT